MKHATPLEVRIMQDVRRLRKAKNLTTTDMGMFLGIGQSQYSHLETGYNHATIDKLHKISIVLGVSLASLIGED